MQELRRVKVIQYKPIEWTEFATGSKKAVPEVRHGIFHLWSTNRVANDYGGFTEYVNGLIEFQDGTLEWHDPKNITFLQTLTENELM